MEVAQKEMIHQGEGIRHLIGDLHGIYRIFLSQRAHRALKLSRRSIVYVMAPQAWYMDSSENDQRLLHRRSPNEDVHVSKLDALGVLSWHLDADSWETDSELAKIRRDRKYTYHDVITVAPDKLPNYEAKIKNFFEEHLHTDEEIRYVLDGSGYFDVRDTDEQWIRIDCRKGDMIVLPAGIYHRFTLDSNNYIKALRLFVGEPVWTPINRPADHLPARVEYVHQFGTAAISVK